MNELKINKEELRLSQKQIVKYIKYITFGTSLVFALIVMFLYLNTLENIDILDELKNNDLKNIFTEERENIFLRVFSIGLLIIVLNNYAIHKLMKKFSLKKRI